MGEIPATRIVAVRRLIEQVPDGAIRTLETALTHGGRADPSIALVRDLVQTELTERQARSAVLAPLLPLCAPPPDGLQRLAFPTAAPALTWRGLKACAPEMVGVAVRAWTSRQADEDTPVVFESLCHRAADGQRNQEPAFQPLRTALAARSPDAPRQFALCLALTPLSRSAIERLPVWVRTLSNDYAAAIRLAFRDTDTVAADAGPPFMEILFSHLEQPFQIMRLISLVMDMPSDRYLASSELASFGERLLGDLDRRIEEVRRFDPSRGLEGGVALGGSIQTCTATMDEFEQWLAIKREGPWGARLVAQRRALALAVEARLREVTAAVAQALPVETVRPGRSARSPPRLAADPDPALVTKAQALLALLYECRATASYGGFGAVRAKLVEALDPRIDQYAEDLIEQLHSGDGSADLRIRAYLEIAAEFLGLVRDPRAAEIVRRRAAVA